MSALVERRDVSALDQQAREYAVSKAIKLNPTLDSIERGLESAFISGATRTLDEVEIEEAAKALAREMKAILEMEQRRVDEMSATEILRDMKRAANNSKGFILYFTLAKAAARALGLQVKICKSVRRT